MYIEFLSLVTTLQSILLSTKPFSLLQAVAKSAGFKHPVVPQSMYIFKVSWFFRLNSTLIM